MFHRITLLPLPPVVRPLPMRKLSPKKHRVTRMVRAMLLFLLRLLPPDLRFESDAPLQVAWNTEVTHFCAFCPWSALNFDGLEWHCSQCGARYEAIPVAEPMQERPHTHTEPLGGHALMHLFNAGKILYGDDHRLYFADDGERVHTSQLPALKRRSA